MKENAHFDKLFWFCCACVSVGIGFLIVLCFVPVPAGSERFADNCQGFFQGSIVTSAMAFLLGGNLPTLKQGNNNAKVTGEISANFTSDAEGEEK